jgi:negative regulator of flagellin synthesis FlgM
MMIDKLGVINPLTTLSPAQRTPAAQSTGDNFDTISVSAEGKARAEAFYLAQVAAETPDVRSALVEQVRLKIQNPGYLNAAIFSTVADKIADSYGL